MLLILIRTFSNQTNLDLILNKNGCPNHPAHGLTLHLFPFHVCSLILFNYELLAYFNLLFRTVHFVKRPIKTKHDYTGIFLKNRYPYFRKHVGNFINVIRILQRMYGFFDLPRNAPAFRINKVLLIAAKAVVRFPTVFCNFILITILIPDRLLCSSERDFKNRLDSQMQTASQ